MLLQGPEGYIFQCRCVIPGNELDSYYYKALLIISDFCPNSQYTPIRYMEKKFVIEHNATIICLMKDVRETHVLALLPINK